MSLSVFKTSVALAAGVLASACFAGPVEDGIRKAIEPRLGGPAGNITKSGFAGLYEVDTPRGLLYTDAKGSFLVVNAFFIDVKTGANLTERRMNELGAFKFSDLPLKDAIKTVRGNGSRVLVSIEDPNCGYCHKVAGELEKIDNVTVYTFLHPLLGEDSVQKAKAIWCAPNRAKVWREFMVERKPLPTKTDCETPLARNASLAQRLRVMGTPTFLFKSGERIPGAAPISVIEQKLAASK
jgi:thiol:disulfide interchange protein DsbC